jgi:hypothetical protein
MSQFTNKNDRRKAARKAGDAKANRRMGRLLSERRYDKASGEATSAPTPRTSELVVTTTKTGVIIPLSRIGQGAPDVDLITDVMKAMSR